MNRLCVFSCFFLTKKLSAIKHVCDDTKFLRRFLNFLGISVNMFSQICAIWWQNWHIPQREKPLTLPSCVSKSYRLAITGSYITCWTKKKHCAFKNVEKSIKIVTHCWSINKGAQFMMLFYNHFWQIFEFFFYPENLKKGVYVGFTEHFPSY